MPSLGRLISCVVLALALLHQVVAHDVGVWVNATIYDDDLKRVSYTPDDIFCGRWTNWIFWKTCAFWTGYWQSQVYYNLGRRVSMHRSLDHRLPSMSIKFEGSAIYLYGPPRNELDAIPGDYRICLCEDHRVRKTQGWVCYLVEVSKAYHAIEDVREPVLIFSKDELRDHKHRLVVSVADPLNETGSYRGIQFSHAVHTIKRPTPWQAEEDHWRFREVAVYATHPSLSYWPDEPVRSWRFWRSLTGWKSKTYTTEDQSIVPWHELSSRDELDQEYWGVETTISGGAALLYGIPKAYITNTNGLGHVCVQIDSGHCEIVDVKHAYLKTEYEDKPVLLWRNDALDPCYVTEISVRLVRGLYGRRSARVFPFKAIHYYAPDTSIQTVQSNGSEWNPGCTRMTPDYETPLNICTRIIQAPERGLSLRDYENPDICRWRSSKTRKTYVTIEASQARASKPIDIRQQILQRPQEIHANAVIKISEDPLVPSDARKLSAPSDVCVVRALLVESPTKTGQRYRSPTLWTGLLGVMFIIVISLTTIVVVVQNGTERAKRIPSHAPLPQYASLPAPPSALSIPRTVSEARFSKSEVHLPQSPAQPESTTIQLSKDDDEGCELPAHIPASNQTETPTPPTSSSPPPLGPENQNNYGSCAESSTTPAEPTDDEVVVPTFPISYGPQSPSEPSNLSASVPNVQVAALLLMQQNTNGTATQATEGSGDRNLLINPHLAQESSPEQRSPLLPVSQTQDGVSIPELAGRSADRSEDTCVPLQAAVQGGQSQPTAAGDHRVFTQDNLQTSEIGHSGSSKGTPSHHSQSPINISCRETDASQPGGQQSNEQGHSESARECDTNKGTNNLGHHQNSEAGGERNERTEKRRGGSGGKRKRNSRGRGRGGGKK